MRRRTLALVTVLAAVATVPAIAALRSLPDAGVRGFRPERRTVAYRTAPVTTNETRFRRIPHLEVLTQGRGVVTARFSGDLSGAPVEIRVLRLRNHALLPGVAHFAPTGEAASFSYDFIDPRRAGEIECRRYAVSWRSPTGAEVTLNHATLTVDYRFDDTNGDGPRAACVD